MARNRNNKWTADLDRRLLEMKAAGKSVFAIAAAFKRSAAAIVQRLYLLRRRERKHPGGGDDTVKVVGLPATAHAGPPDPLEVGQMAEPIIDTRERYVGYATICLQLAKVISDNESRLVLKEMASEWLRLAEEAEAGGCD
jgi:hypothetical protein